MNMCLGRDDVWPSPQEAIGERVRALAYEAGARPSDHGFTRMFPTLDREAHRLPAGPHTLRALARLAHAMAEPPCAAPEPRRKAAGDGDIPAAYTYLLQFVLHDLVFEHVAGSEARRQTPAFTPLADLACLLNRRSGCLDLDSLYDAPRDPSAVRQMFVGEVAATAGGALARPARKGGRNDLPRLPGSQDPGRDRVVRIGDPRNDDMLILSQLHVAFLKAHNALVASGLSFDAARRALRRRYQWMVLFDLLSQICDPDILDDVLDHGPRLWAPSRRIDLFMPVEFFAAFALAPAMARQTYDYNPNFRNIERGALATRFALGCAGRGPRTLPEHWIIAWEGFLPLEAAAPQRARCLNTRLAGAPATVAAIAAQQLLRGYRLGLPTGQAVARQMGLAPLAGEAFLATLPADQREAAAPFADATPLWFYVLAEAGNPAGSAGGRLGPLGSRMVAEAMWTFVRHADDSILAPDTPLDFDRFTLSDLVLLAGERDLLAS